MSEQKDIDCGFILHWLTDLKACLKLLYLNFEKQIKFKKIFGIIEHKEDFKGDKSSNLKY